MNCLSRKIGFFITLIVLILATIAGAGTTGKISGIVQDADAKSPLPGANVVIEGTTIGGAADENGYYVILNVAPGTYNLKVTMIGYKPVTIQGVVVTMNLGTSIDIAMKTEVLDMSEIVVIAKRPVVVREVSHSQMNVEAKTISMMPVKEVADVISLQAGVQGLSIRGSASSQTAFIVDGFNFVDERSNVPVTTLSLASVKEVQVQTGGFNAEYGNIRSGIVNIITDEGRKDKYSGAISLVYQPAASKHFGISAYDKYSYYNRPYYDPAVCYVGTQNGTWDDYTKTQYTTFEGWNSYAQATLKDSDPSNDLTPEGAKRLYAYQHRRQGDIKKPYYVGDLGFGGPVPFISEKLGNLRFYLSYQDLVEQFIVPVARPNFHENTSRIKLTSDVTSKMTLTLTGMYALTQSVSSYQWTTTPTGTVLRSDYGIAALATATKEVAYVPYYYSPSDIYHYMVGAKINHVLSARTFYEASIQYFYNRYNTYQASIRDTSKTFEVLDGYYVDESPYGYWGYSTGSVDGMRTGGWMNLGRDSSTIATVNMQFDFTSQVNRSNQIKTGVNVVFNDYNIRSTTSTPAMETWCRSQIYRVKPYRAGVYIQDKLEFEGFIANLGLRLDYSDANTARYELDMYSKYYKVKYGNTIEDSVISQNSKARLNLSPRMGISHPITENSKLYFNYGHFRSEPASTYRFRLQREYNGLVTSIGDPDLELEKTVAYELGYSQNLFNQWLLNICGYYKDITNQIDWIYYQNINGTVQYSKSANNNYEDIRGVEITLDKRTGNWLTGFVNYTYMVDSYGYFGLKKYFENPSDQRDYLAQNPYQEKPHPAPYARINIDVHSPFKFGPNLKGIYLLGGWNCNLLATWNQGSYATYNPQSVPGLQNNVQWVDSYNMNLRLTKSIQIKQFAIQGYIDVTNLFNFKYLSYAGFVSSRDYTDYLASLHFSWEDGQEHGHDRIGTYRNYSVEYDPIVPYISNPTDDPEVAAENAQIKKDNARRLKTKSYINMPNNSSFAFLYPREIKFGIKFTF
ncbi:MAG: TonB-dependent receptor [Candidatus Marinimicrobia bacterium]|nr:TonB-dependent receptor [Candidatus Neomarinimicrobiota bacterium]